MHLVVFHEFAASDAVLDEMRAILPLDKAPQPNPMAKTAEEKMILATNAKLFFSNADTPDAVDAVLAKLSPLGLEVVHRHPVTSAGCPMLDRVILKFHPEPTAA